MPYTNIPSKVIDSRHRFSSSFSDFVTRYTAISSTNRKTETAEYYAKDPDDGLTMNLGVNPLLQFGLDETRKRILNGILDAISIVEYVPFDSDTIGDPALDLGDVPGFTYNSSNQYSYIVDDDIVINGWYFLNGEPKLYLRDTVDAGSVAWGRSQMARYKTFAIREWMYHYYEYSLYKELYLFTPYLATINNLGSPVIKTADKTMKITYTITESN